MTPRSTASPRSKPGRSERGVAPGAPRGRRTLRCGAGGGSRCRWKSQRARLRSRRRGSEFVDPASGQCRGSQRESADQQPATLPESFWRRVSGDVHSSDPEIPTESAAHRPDRWWRASCGLLHSSFNGSNRYRHAPALLYAGIIDPGSAGPRRLTWFIPRRSA
jgi:hypothetical protein